VNVTGPNRAHINLAFLLNREKSGIRCAVSIGHRNFRPKQGTILKVNVEGLGEIEVDLDDDDLLRLSGQALTAYQTKQESWHDSRPTRAEVYKRLDESGW
jgi:hypothetical protein